MLARLTLVGVLAAGTVFPIEAVEARLESAPFAAEPEAAPQSRRKKKKDEFKWEAPPGDRFEVPDENLTIVFTGLDGFTESKSNRKDGGGQQKKRWTGKIGRSDVSIEYWVIPRADFWFSGPEDVVGLIEGDRAKRAKKGQIPFSFQETFPVAGSYGYFAYGWVGVHTAYKDTKPMRHMIALGGLLKDVAYTLEISCEPALLKEELEIVRTFLSTGVYYAGETLEIEWTDEETEARWERDAPKRVQKQDKLGVIRTKHYAILTNMRAKGGTARKFGKKMEECYETIRKIFPFEDIPGERLLPVFLFRTDDQYHDFLVETIGWSMEQARRTGGVAWRDFYATSYSAPNDPVHIHEATHQIFKNRLRLNGGGSWFQEGVAEYVETSPNDRKLFRNKVKKEEHVPLREFFAMKSLIFSNDIDKKKGDIAGDMYRQAGCIIEFAAESKWAKKQFQKFVHEVGKVPRNNVEGIEQALRRVYGVGIEGFEEQFLKYWKKR